MLPSSPPPKGVRGFLKGTARRVKNAFKPQAPATGSGTSSPLPQPSLGTSSSQLVPTHERLLQSAAQSQQSVISPQPVPSTSQPTPSVSLLAPEAIQPANTDQGLTQAVKKARGDAWLGLKTTLQVLENSDIFLPLKPAVSGFLEVVDMFKAAAQNRDDYAALASNLQGMINEFSEHPGEHTSSKMSDALKAMSNVLREEMGHVQEQQRRSGLRRGLGAGQDFNDVEGCYRRVDTLCSALQNKAMLRIWSIGEEQQQDARLDRLNTALKAMYDSSYADVIGRRTCTPGTREAILVEMQKWADDLNGPKVYWLNGMAGTGKTTLAYSFCAELNAARRLGASFFCSRTDPESRDVSRIVPTIAYQLARLLPAYREELIWRIGEDKDIGAREMKTQFEKLIREPFHKIKAPVPQGLVVAIDALDECNGRDGARNILKILFQHARDLPIKFLVTCRPEPGLFDELQSKNEYHRSVLHLHDIEMSFVQADIRTYLEAELGDLSLSGDKLGQLVEQTGTLFIYAATAVRYINPKDRQVNFHQRLDNLLSIASKSNKQKGIDDLYSAVLTAAFADDDADPTEIENIQLVLDTAVCAREPMSVSTMTKLLGLNNEQDIMLALQHLRSVLHVSPGEGLISTFHASFPDFMLSPKRSGDHRCKAAEHNHRLALCCFSTMQRLLRFNICELESSFVLDKDTPNLEKIIGDSISPELFYACRYWGDHLGRVDASVNARSALDEFLRNRLLFWMEVMNLRNCMGVGTQILSQAHRWLQKSGGADDTVGLALDAERFASVFAMSPASRSTPHIYISTLAFWPKTRPVGLQYRQHARCLIRLEGPAMQRRDLSCLATWTATSRILCVAFSPDGTRIVSGSNDNTIRVWDARSGDVVAGPFEGHTGTVNSVAFSSDGTRIVSGSYDRTIRVWDAHSGDVIAGPFKGHTYTVSSVAFSSDGTLIVSGSWDNTIRVWDARSGDVMAGPFKGHTNSVRSVMFSSDGTRIVSGSGDSTIRVWDAHSGDAIAGPFKGHTYAVNSVAFSSDGTRIVSGSDDKTIRVWDAHSGDVVAGPFEGHTRSVRSVAFSSDDTRIVSGSWDDTIRVWDAGSGDVMAGPFQGHTGPVNSVTFSSDGILIVSGSDDRTIRVWDARTRDVVAEPFEGHTGPVNSVAFSSDGTRIVSGSEDGTIRVWDAHSGDVIAGPFMGHTDAVNSVVFSSDGNRIVSGSSDSTIRVWDAHSGDVIAGPFKGHINTVSSVAFSSDSTRIVSGSYDKTIRVWDAHSGDVIAGPFKGHTYTVSSVAFSSDGTLIVSGSWDDTIRVWDARSGDVMAGPFEGHTNSVRSVMFSSDSTRIVSGSYDKTIRVWDAHSGDVVAGPFEGHTAPVNFVAFSSDGTRIVSGSDDRTVRVWDARSGDVVARPFEGHAKFVNSVAFSLDGNYIVSGSADTTIRVWHASALDTRDSRPFGSWTIDEAGSVTTPQGQLLLCVPADLRIGLVKPENMFCIYSKGSLLLDFDGVSFGHDWVRCYQCQ